MQFFLPELFLNVLRMSLTASYVILFVLIVRLLLKKAPKVFSYSLWGIVLFRLICPASFTSSFSLLRVFEAKNANNMPVYMENVMQSQTSSNAEYVSQIVDRALPATKPVESADPIQVGLLIGAVLWVLGILFLISYSMLSYIKLKRKVSTALRKEGNIYECEKIQSPFVLGIIEPKVYLPMGFAEKERSYILKHEETHIRRLDYLIKPLAFLVLCVHWFNPLVWLSFIMMNKDMEMSCDEKVLKEMGPEIKKDYSSSLLSLAAGGKMISGSPLAFGESSTKSRIKNVLSYKRPTFWGIITAAILIGVLAVGLLADPKKEETYSSYLKVSYAASEMMQREVLMIRLQGHGASVTSGKDLGQWLSEKASVWQEKKAVPKNLLPTLIVYINKNTGYKVCFYESQPELAMIAYEGEERYYQSTAEDYKELWMRYGLSSYLVPEPVVQAITEGKKTQRESVDDVPRGVGRDYKVIKIYNDIYYLYESKNKFYCEQPYVSINEIPEAVYKEAVKFAEIPREQALPAFSAETVSLVETHLAVIMSSPNSSSNPNDYIKAHSAEYESILKYGGEEALAYMLLQFEAGNAEGLRGHIMMRLCKELLGQRNNVKDETLLPMEWFNRLSVRQEVKLPDFAYKGQDAVQKLVYETEMQQYKDSQQGFTMIAPHVFGSYKEGNKLKVFVTTFVSHYRLYDKTLSQEGGAVIPAAITYIKNSEGGYVLEKHEQAQDGSYFAPSIKKYCVMPVSGKTIKGLSDKILKHYRDYEDIIQLERKSLIQHLKENQQYHIFLYQEGYQKPSELIPLT